MGELISLDIGYSAKKFNSLWKMNTENQEDWRKAQEEIDKRPRGDKEK